jgi:RHS repeat-associated protein
MKKVFLLSVIVWVMTAITLVADLRPVFAETEESKSANAANAEGNVFKTGDPVTASGGEYYFYEEAVNLGGPLSLDFQYHYGSGLQWKIAEDGLPGGFAHNRQGGIFRIRMNGLPEEVLVSHEFAREIGFWKAGEDFQVFDIEGRRHQLEETENFYFMKDADTDLVYIFQKPETEFSYTTMELASKGSEGKVEEPNDVYEGGISANGRYVVFYTQSPKMVPDDTNNVSDVFVRDLLTRETERVSVASDGTQGNSYSEYFSISADGRYVAFRSYANNLIVGQVTPPGLNIYLRDRQTKETSLISRKPNGDPAGGKLAVVSGDGRYVAFVTQNQEMFEGDTQYSDDIFRYDRQTGAMERVSISWDGQNLNKTYIPDISISHDGRYIAFNSEASNIVQNDTNNVKDLFVRDMQTGVTFLASLAHDGSQAEKACAGKISADGRKVVFKSGSANLAPDDTNNQDDIFVRDLATGEVRRVSVSSDGRQGTRQATEPSISANGRYVAFTAWSDGLVEGDNNGNADILVYDLATGKTMLASIGPDGKRSSNSFTRESSISANGEYVAFRTDTAGFTNDDYDTADDIIVAARVRPDNAVLVGVRDRNGNALNHEGSLADLKQRGPDKITDGLGRELRFTYQTVNSQPTLTQIEDQSGRQWKFAYTAGRALQSVTDPLNQVMTFAYNANGKMTGKQMPEGNTPYSQTYDPDTPEVIKTQTDADNNTMTLVKNAFDPWNDQSQFSVEYPDGGKQDFEHQHNARFMKSMSDQAGKPAQFVTDGDHDRLAEVVDRLGARTLFTYHPASGYMETVTNANGHTLRMSYTAQDQTFTSPALNETAALTFYLLEKIEYPDGTFDQYEYDEKGNRIKWTDPSGKEWIYTCNDRGQVLTETNPLKGVTAYTYNDDGTPASAKDSGTGVTTFEYDGYKRLVKIIRPDTKFMQIGYDLNDRITSVTDENNEVYAFVYDKNDNLTQITDPAGNETRYGHDLMDRIKTVTDREGGVSNLAYSNMGRLESVTDPAGIKTELSYDPRGWLNRTTLAGKSWTVEYDDEGVPAGYSTPSGRKTRVETDNVGRIVGVTNPMNHKHAMARDELGRITEITDALSRKTVFDYGADGSLARVTLPEVGGAAYGRNDMGLLSEIKDLNGSKWGFGYTDMGRPNRMTDPLAQLTQISYDALGRPSHITFPDTAAQTLTYDDADNLTRAQYSDGTDLQFGYDALDQVISANGIALTRDKEGRITETVNHGVLFGAVYDKGGRVQTLSYNNSAFTVTYSYAPDTGLLTDVSDSLTSAQIGFTYDEDLRLTGMTRSNGVNTVLTWDNADRLTRIQDAKGAATVLDLQYTLDAAGQVTSADMNGTGVISPADFFATQKNTLTYDAASQVSAAGYAYDRQGRLTAGDGHTFVWDGASRLIGMDGVTLAYNDLGDVMSRTQAGTETRFFCNYAAGLAPIMADKNETTAAFRYYVWTPRGQLLYMIDTADGNKVYFHHFDRTGSTLALTDGTGAVTDTYAYTPYGRLLKHNGTNPQPFTFAGQWGMRQESATLYHARARYYDAKTARFLSREPIWPEISDPKMLNPYQYALLDPIRQNDATGTVPNDPFECFWNEFREIGGEVERIKEEIDETEYKQRFTMGIIAIGTTLGVTELASPEEKKEFRKQLVKDLKNFQKKLKKLEQKLKKAEAKRRKFVQGKRETIEKLKKLALKFFNERRFSKYEFDTWQYFLKTPEKYYQ